jgi:hypothetical protein
VTPDLRTAEFFARWKMDEDDSFPVVLVLDLRGIPIYEDPYFELGGEREFLSTDPEMVKKVRRFKGKLFVVDRPISWRRIRLVKYL